MTSVYGNDAEMQSIAEAFNAGRGTIKQLYRYCELAGKHYGAVFQDALGSFESITYDETSDIMRDALSELWADISGAAAQVHQGKLQRAGISFRATQAALDADMVNNLIYKVTGGNDAAVEDTKWAADSRVIGEFAKGAANETLEENTERLQEAGVTVRMTRSSNGKCCDWCESVCGSYQKGSEPADFWRTHADCTCTIDYVPSKGRASRVGWQTVNGRLRRTTTTL